MTPGFNEDEYKALWMGFAPRPIASEDELEPTERRIWQLLAVDQRSFTQEVYLSVLTSMVAAWEDEHVTIPRLETQQLANELLNERGLRQKDLVPIFGTESIVSEVLSGKRRLQLDHVTGLAEFFHVPVAVFFPRDPQRKSTSGSSELRRPARPSRQRAV